jgi:hypothetical protein
MRWPRLNLGTVALSMALLIASPAARADPIMELRNVRFDDGGTATGSFDLNVYGYLSALNVASAAGATLGGAAYITGGPVGAPPSAVFSFGNPGSVFELVLALATPLGYGSGGVDAIIPGSLTGNGLTGSYERCVSNQIFCGVPFGTARLATAGEIDVPEPATTGLFGMAALLVLRSANRRYGRLGRDPA